MKQSFEEPPQNSRRDHIERALPDILAPIDRALCAPFSQMIRRVESWRQRGARIVMCHGCFDFLHVGHVRHFIAARAMGDLLVVTITADPFVAKGPGRPVFSADERLLMVQSLRTVAAAAINLWPSAAEAIQLLKPAVFAKGADYRDRSSCNPNIQMEEEAILRVGGQLRYTDEPSYSSSKLIQQLRAQ